MQAAPGVYAIRAVGCTVYLLGGVQLTLVDAGGPGSAPRILRAIQRLEHRPQDLTRILLTHVDMDHVGGLGALVAATGAGVYAQPEALRQLAHGEIPTGERGLRSSLVALRRFLSPGPSPTSLLSPLEGGRRGVGSLADGMVLPILGGLGVIFTFGHAPDHTAYFLQLSRLVLAGDLLAVEHGRLVPQPGPAADERQQTVVALRRLAGLDPLAILPAHGPPYRDNIAVRLVRLAEELEE